MLLSVLFACLLIGSNGYKILVHSPTLTRSHMISTGRVADVLHLDGHNVTVLELHYAFKPGSIDSVQHANLWKYDFDWTRRPRNFLASEHTGNILHEPSISEYFNGKYAWHEMMADACLIALKNGTLIEEIKHQQFDVIMMEQLEWCGQAISHLAGIKTRIWLSSCPLMEHMSYALGLPAPYSYVPATMDNSMLDKMSMLERVKNMFLGTMTQLPFIYGARITREKLNNALNVDLPDLVSLAADVPLIFTNIDEFLTFPRPSAPNVINIGGLGLGTKVEQPPLKSPFKELMEKGEKGVIYFALGSVLPTNHLPSSFRRNMLQAFGNLKDYQFIVKISNDDQESREIAKAFPNIYLTTWAPQTSISAHPRLRLLIAHGGFNSLLEAARYGIPVLLIPLANDGYSNARLVERNRWGVYFEKRQLLYSHKEFQSSIEHILNTPSYKEAALRTQRIFLNKPMSPEEKLTKYVRLLEMSDGTLQELQSIAHKLSLVELYNLDVFFVLFLFVAFLVFVTIFSFKWLLGRLFKRKAKKE